MTPTHPRSRVSGPRAARNAHRTGMPAVVLPTCLASAARSARVALRFGWPGSGSGVAGARWCTRRRAAAPALLLRCCLERGRSSLVDRWTGCQMRKWPAWARLPDPRFDWLGPDVVRGVTVDGCLQIDSGRPAFDWLVPRTARSLWKGGLTVGEELICRLIESRR